MKLLIICAIAFLLGVMLSDIKSFGQDTVITNPDGTYVVIKSDGTRENCSVLGDGPVKTVICH